MHECQEIWSANINQKEDHFLIYERDLLLFFPVSPLLVPPLPPQAVNPKIQLNNNGMVNFFASFTPFKILTLNKMI